MRATLLLLTLIATTAGCAWMPGLDNPAVSLSPRLYLYKLRGKTRMQSFSSGALVENAAMDLAAFGQRDRDEDLGGVVAIGDGFSGIELFYQKVEMDSTRRGLLTADWGDLPQGTEVHPKFLLEEYRIAYVGELFEHETDDEMRVRLGIGAAVVHRDAKFVAEETDRTGLSQRANFRDDGVPYGTVRARVDYRGAGAQIDYSYNPDVTFGGDFEGVMQDLELTLSYTLEAQDLTLLAGYRWSELPASGHAGPYLHDEDFRLEGYFLGLSFGF